MANWDVQGSATVWLQGGYPTRMDHCKPGTAAAHPEKAIKLCWYGHREGGRRGRIIDSQRALRFTGHKMEVSRTCCKSGQPISSIPYRPFFFQPQGCVLAVRHNATLLSTLRCRTILTPLDTAILPLHLHVSRCGFV